MVRGKEGPVPGDRIIFGAAALPEPERDWLAAAERLPIESLWQGGHVLPRQPTGEAITRLALLTAWTERVRAGTATLLLPLHHPAPATQQGADPAARSGACHWAWASAACSPTSSRPWASRWPSAAPAPTRPWACCAPCGPAVPSPTMAASSTSTT